MDPNRRQPRWSLPTTLRSRGSCLVAPPESQAYHRAFLLALTRALSYLESLWPSSVLLLEHWIRALHAFCAPIHDLVPPPVFCTSHAIALDSDRRSTTVHQFTGRSLLGWQGRRFTLYAVEHIYAAEWASIDLRLLI